jgi:hypothetical protein
LSPINVVDDDEQLEESKQLKESQADNGQLLLPSTNSVPEGMAASEIVKRRRSRTQRKKVDGESSSGGCDEAPIKGKDFEEFAKSLM